MGQLANTCLDASSQASSLLGTSSLGKDIAITSRNTSSTKENRTVLSSVRNATVIAVLENLDWSPVVGQMHQRLASSQSMSASAICLWVSCSASEGCRSLFRPILWGELTRASMSSHVGNCLCNVVDSKHRGDWAASHCAQCW